MCWLRLPRPGALKTDLEGVSTAAKRVRVVRQQSCLLGVVFLLLNNVCLPCALFVEGRLHVREEPSQRR